MEMIKKSNIMKKKIIRAIKTNGKNKKICDISRTRKSSSNNTETFVLTTKHKNWNYIYKLQSLH